MAADIAAEALHGGHGDLSARCTRWRCCSRWTAPVRATRSSACSAEYDVLILDRWVASNAAYSAARLHQDADGDVVAWVRELEYGRLRLPAPDWQVLLDVPAELAAERAEHRANTEADRAKDAYERDGDLQRRTGQVYSELAADALGRPVVGGRTRHRRRSASCRAG